MKKIVYLFFLGIALTAFGQQGRYAFQDDDLSAEQRAVLKTKKMALDLDLSDAQQKQMLEANKKWMTQKDKHFKEMQALKQGDTKPSAEQRYARMNEMLDLQLAHQKEVKGILNQDQYDTWKKYRKYQAQGSNCRKPGGKPKKPRQGKP